MTPGAGAHDERRLTLRMTAPGQNVQQTTHQEGAMTELPTIELYSDIH